MNFDGIAFVVQNRENLVISEYGSCFVLKKTFLETSVKQSIKVSNSRMKIPYTTGKINKKDSFVFSESSDTYGIVPSTVKVFDGPIKNDNSIDFDSTKIFVSSNTKKCFSDVELEERVISSLIVPTNIIPKETYVFHVVDARVSEKQVPLKGITVQVTDKTSIVIPDTTEVQGFSIVVQKNNFVEIVFTKIPTSVEGIPDGMEFTGTSIKGTIYKSGEYDVIVRYSNNQQNLNIVVPYYQRLL
jgi:hypothetical protein